MHTLAPSIAPEGDSGRSGFSPRLFLYVLWRSSCSISMWVNILWPFVPVAMALHLALPAARGDEDATPSSLVIFALSYVAMVPSANLLGFAGHALARKMPRKVAGILIETTIGSLVEVILFVVLIAKHRGADEDAALDGHGDNGNSGEEGDLIPIIQAAILGSIVTNLLLCLGVCFFCGGLRHRTQQFHAVVSEVGNGLLLVAAFGLLIPSAFYSALKGETEVVTGSTTIISSSVHSPTSSPPSYTEAQLQSDVVRLSRATSVVLLVSFGLYIAYYTLGSGRRRNSSSFDAVLERDELRDADLAADEARPQFTLTEVVVAIVVALTCVVLLLIILVGRIEDVVDSGVPDQFLGLILLPLVEKAAEHLTAVDEAWGKSCPLSRSFFIFLLICIFI